MKLDSCQIWELQETKKKTESAIAYTNIHAAKTSSSAFQTLFLPLSKVQSRQGVACCETGLIEQERIASNPIKLVSIVAYYSRKRYFTKFS